MKSESRHILVALRRGERSTIAVLNKEVRKVGKKSGILGLKIVPAFLPSLFRPLFLIYILFLAPKAHADLTIASAISMSDALEEISKSYSTETGEKIRHTFAGSNVLARQIEAGAAVDVFVSADSATMDALRKKNLIVAATVRIVASNQLVVVIPKESKLVVKTSADLLPVKRIAIADPDSVPAGIYARNWLKAEGIWAEVKPQTIPLQNVRAALIAVETGNADVGLVYRTDAFSSEKVRIAFSAPMEKTGAIDYPAAVVAGSSQQATAKGFLEFLASEKATAIFAKHGFGSP